MISLQSLNNIKSKAMNKYEYMEKIANLREQAAQLKKEYIESNEQYAPGTKVKVTGRNGKSRIGIVKYNIVSDVTHKDVVPLVMLLTNDGKESLRRIVIYPEDTIEVITD